MTSDVLTIKTKKHIIKTTKHKTSDVMKKRKFYEKVGGF